MTPPLIDGKTERALVAALIAAPEQHDTLPHELGLDVLADLHAQHAFEAFANVRARGEVVTPETVRAEIERRTGHADHGWFDALVFVPKPVATVRGWAETLIRLAARRAEAIAAAEHRAVLDAELDEFALRDAEPAPSAAQQVRERLARHELPASDAAQPAEQPRPRWIVPLESFLGDDEPDDDDSEDWIIRDIIPRGEAALLAGPPKGGKTWSMISLGLDVAAGKPWLDSYENTMGGPARVLLLAFEDGQRRLRKRVWELARSRGISPNNPIIREHLAISREPLRLPDSRDERDFAAELKAWKPSLVLIDNLTRVMVGDQNAIKDAKRFGDMWCKLCTDVGASVTFLHHTSKVGALRLDTRNEGDPFELIRGSSDLVAAARHLVLMRPIDSEGDEKLSDVRMRGNLDLTREDFVLGFQRDQRDQRWFATLADRGDGPAFRAERAATRKATAEAKKKAAHAAVTEHRRNIALEILNREGACSSRRLADAVGVASSQTVLPVLQGLASSGVVVADKKRGFVFADQDSDRGAQ